MFIFCLKLFNFYKQTGTVIRLQGVAAFGDDDEVDDDVALTFMWHHRRRNSFTAYLAAPFESVYWCCCCWQQQVLSGCYFMSLLKKEVVSLGFISKKKKNKENGTINSIRKEIRCVKWQEFALTVKHMFYFDLILIRNNTEASPWLYQNYPHNWGRNQACRHHIPTTAIPSVSRIWPVSDLKIIYLWQSAAVELEWQLCFISLNTARQINKSWC